VQLLNHRLDDIAWQIPPENMPLERNNLSSPRELPTRYVSRLFVDRATAGIAVPHDSCLRRPRREWEESLLSQMAVNASQTT